jgi:hypothetical protein
MYKDRIKTWRLDKKNKEHDMVAILRKKTERKAVGKQTSFRVRGQVVTMENVLHYLKRKKGKPEIGISTASTPSDISCWTPSPVHTPQSIDDGTEIISANHRASEAHFNNFLPLTPVNNDIDAGVVGMGWTPAPLLADENIIQLTVNDIYDFLSDCSRISRSPSPPQTLLVAEDLLFSIKTYVDGSLESGTWISDENGYCTTRTPAGTIAPDYTYDFSTYCRLAAGLVEKGPSIEFRRALSKAFNLVQDLLRAENPRTLDCLFDVYLYLISKGLPEIVSMLRNYINEMAANIIVRENPWGHICRLIGMLDAESLEQAIVKSWKCTLDAFGKALRPLSLHALTVHIQFINRVYSSVDLLKEEKLLQGLLAQFEQRSSMSTLQAAKVNLVKCSLGYNAILQRNYTEAEELGLDILSRAQEEKLWVNKVEALEVIAWSQFQQHKTNSAEMNMLDAIKLVVDHWGITDPWAIRNMIHLEGWLRNWGREEDADKLKAKIGQLIGRDEIDEQNIEE